MAAAAVSRWARIARSSRVLVTVTSSRPEAAKVLLAVVRSVRV